MKKAQKKYFFKKGGFRDLAKKAQGILEYVWMICIIITVLLIMGLYIRNSLSGKYRETIDGFGGGEIYSPGNTIVEVKKENR